MIVAGGVWLAVANSRSGLRAGPDDGPRLGRASAATT